MRIYAPALAPSLPPVLLRRRLHLYAIGPLILPLHNRANKGGHPAQCLPTRRSIEIELIFMRKRRAVAGREAWSGFGVITQIS